MNLKLSILKLYLKENGNKKHSWLIQRTYKCLAIIFTHSSNLDLFSKYFHQKQCVARLHEEIRPNHH